MNKQINFKNQVNFRIFRAYLGGITDKPVNKIQKWLRFIKFIGLWIG